MSDDKEKRREIFLAKSLRSLQENVRNSGPAAAAGYTLIGSILLLGGIGYAIDAWRGTSPWFLLSGLLLGLIVGFLELAKIIWNK
jgi:F0F1-type ATP synthase assembly protein I